MLRKMFGPSREEVWRALSSQIGARYVEGGFCSSARIQAAHGPWTITLDTYTVSSGAATAVYTRMRAPYVNPDGFRFSVYRRHMFTDVAAWLGMQDVHVGHEAFDRDFVIKGTHESRLRLLFDNERIRQLLSAQRSVKFTVKDDEGWFGPTFPDRVDELSFVVTGVIKDIDRLKALYDLFAETLDQLCLIGSAYDVAPDVAL